MPTRNPFSPYNWGNVPIVDRFIGNAYEVVKYVARHIELIRYVAQHMEEIYTVAKAVKDGTLAGGGSGGGSTGMANPMTTVGDLIVGGASGAPARLGAGQLNYLLMSNGPSAAPAWKPFSVSAQNVSGLGDLAEIDLPSLKVGRFLKDDGTWATPEGGGGDPGDITASDVSYDGSAVGLTSPNVQAAINELVTVMGQGFAQTIQNPAIEGTNGQVLTYQNGAKVWATPSGGGGGGSPQSVVLNVTSSYREPTSADNNRYLRFTSNSYKEIYLYGEEDTPLPDNWEVHVRNVGNNLLEIFADQPAVLNVPAGGSAMVPTGGTVTIKRVSPGVFDLIGYTEAA